MTYSTDPATLLALTLYKLGEPLVITKRLLEDMKPVNIVLTEDQDTVTLSITSSEVIVAVPLDIKDELV